MSLTLPERRRIVVVNGEQRVDLAVPLDDTLDEVLRSVGLALEPGRHVVVERTGAETLLATRGTDLVDGAMYSVIDLRTQLDGQSSRRAKTATRDSGALWWMLAAVAVVAIGIQALEPNTRGQDATLQRVVASAALGLAAFASALVWARRHPADVTTDAVSMLSPLTLAFAAGFVLVPLSLMNGIHLAVVAGLLMAAVLAALLTVAVGGLRLRSAVGVATAILLVLGAIWGLTLLSGMGIAAAAAISAGAVPLALRALPTTLLAIDDGFHIDYEKFMSSRWTVRGAVPVSPKTIGAATVRDVVDESSAQLLAGTALLSAVPVVTVPLALTADLASSPFVLGGTIGLLATVVIALVLISRHTANPLLRWIPRGAAVAIVLVAIAAATVAFGALALTAAAAAFLAIGVFAAVLLVPIGRGARSLVWSRMADVFEALAVALSLPAALLAADLLSVVRGMMAA